MATHSSLLAWQTPWTEKPGGLYSPLGLQRVSYDLVSKQQSRLGIAASLAGSCCWLMMFY